MVQWSSTRHEILLSRKEIGSIGFPNIVTAEVEVDLMDEIHDDSASLRTRELVLLPPDKLPEYSTSKGSNRFLKPNEYEFGRRRHHQFVDATAKYMKTRDLFTVSNMLLFLGAIIHWIVRTHVAAFMAPKDPSYYSGFFWTEGGVITTFGLFIVQALGILATKREFILLFLAAMSSLAGYSLYYMFMVVSGGSFSDLEILHILLVCVMLIEIRLAIVILKEMKKPEVKKLIASWDQEEYYDPSTPEGYEKLLRAYLLA